ncbi:ShlB/FhaC/HecB family hemolysin secretion/activation protein [Trinickia terrae]|uniref:ShlB/FhaC/HecB family hemolysin secretion/activation protein n=1 Tax=Trinickia terrae TaxID=2571161 RepID=A0A4U1I3E1_9BURK|nr:ShlB/FhaC/HecB family hemolysin secretion/activation protein [Trinickia terrae]TKC87744.1 ShlB/FhaC/HecB family hemolysin secretion/activation protein [Trinickia terrae]
MAGGRGVRTVSVTAMIAAGLMNSRRSARLTVFAGLGAALACAMPDASAQLSTPVPDAGSTLRNQLQSLPPPALPSSNAEIHIEPTAAPKPSTSTLRFAVKGFQIDGNTKFSNAALMPLLAPALGEQRTLGDLDEAATRVTDFYRAHGYLVARAYVPAQDIRDGIVGIAVVEGRYGKVEIHNASHVRDAVLQRYVSPAHLGEVVDERRLDRTALLIQDMTGTSAVTGNLSAGEAPGTSDLAIDVPPVRSLTASLQGDNYGIRPTGRDRVGASLQWLSPLGFGDRLDAHALTSITGQTLGQLGYSAPLGSDGLRTGITLTESTYRLGADFSSLDAYGHATVLSWTTSYPLIRSRAFNLNVEGGFDRKSLTDHEDASADEKFDNVYGAGINGNVLAGKTLASYALRVEAGDVHFESADALATDQSSAQSAGHYRKYTYSFALYQAVTPKLQLYLALSGQQASKNLVSSEKFSLGGPYGVRAYPTGEAPGDEGYLATAEARWAVAQSLLPGQLGVYGFVDTGFVRDNVYPFTTDSNHRRLSGAGIGVTLANAPSYEVRLVYAHKLGNAAAVADTDHAGRVWLQLTKAF